MKKALGLLFVLSFFNCKASLSIEGFYQGKNLYVQSSVCGDGFGYCATKITVNGNIVPGQTNKGAFEINFSNFNLQMGQPLFIVIEHNEDCKPKIINPEVLLPSSTFVVQSIKCDAQGKLTWTTTKESGKLTYQIEQYKWNKWIVVGEVSGEGKSTTTEYSFSVFPHSGENKIRVSQVDNTGKKRFSKEVDFICTNVKTPIIETDDEYKSIKFMSNGVKVQTKYEIFDAFGNVLKKGLNDHVDFSDLEKGIYYINYDNKNEKIVKG